MKLTLIRWNLPYKEFHKELVCLARLDRYNKTRYSRRKKKEGLLELASREAHERQAVYFATVLNDDGSHRGRFASPQKDDGSMFTFQSRALRGDEADYAELYDLVVLEDISVEQGSIIPWFNHPGQGIQIIFSEDIEELIKKGKIAIRNLKKIK